MTIVDKTEVAVFGALLTLSLRKGMVEEARTLVRLVGRVVFRAAVRCALAKLVTETSKAQPSTNRERWGGSDVQPITPEEVAATDWDVLFRQLLGLDTGEDTSQDHSER
jgi:hypothetical protein